MAEVLLINGSSRRCNSLPFVGLRRTKEDSTDCSAVETKVAIYRTSDTDQFNSRSFRCWQSATDIQNTKQAELAYSDDDSLSASDNESNSDDLTNNSDDDIVVDHMVSEGLLKVDTIEKLDESALSIIDEREESKYDDRAQLASISTNLDNTQYSFSSEGDDSVIIDKEINGQAVVMRQPAIVKRASCPQHQTPHKQKRRPPVKSHSVSCTRESAIAEIDTSPIQRVECTRSMFEKITPSAASGALRRSSHSTSSVRPFSSYHKTSLVEPEPEDLPPALDRLQSLSSPSVDTLTDAVPSSLDAKADKDAVIDALAAAGDSIRRSKKGKSPSRHLPVWSMMSPRQPFATGGLFHAVHSSEREESSKLTKALSVDTSSVTQPIATTKRSKTFFNIGRKSKRKVKDEKKTNPVSVYTSFSKTAFPFKPHFFMDLARDTLALCDVCSTALRNEDSNVEPPMTCNACGLCVHAACKPSEQPGMTCSKDFRKPSLPAMNLEGISVLDAEVSLRHSTSQQRSRRRNNAHRNTIGPTIGPPIPISNPNNPPPATSPEVRRRPSAEIRPPSEIQAPSALTSLFAANLSDPRWKELNLFGNECEAWSTDKERDVLKSMHSKDIKRQDIMHELIVTEKHHCRTLVIMKQTYYRSLVNAGVDQVDLLFPMLDLLIEIHYEFLRALRDRQRRSTVIQTISDVIESQFSGENGDRMESAYAEFCSKKDKAVSHYHVTVNNATSSVSEALKNIQKNPEYKDKSLPDCLLRIAQRPTKYHVLIEQLRKNTRVETNDVTSAEHAERLVKQLLQRINSSVERRCLERSQNEIRQCFDNRSQARLGDRVYTADDLVSSERQLLSMAPAYLRNAHGKKIPVFLLLFNDMLVLLSRSSQGHREYDVQSSKPVVYSFAQLESKPPVIPLANAYAREKAGRTGLQGIFLICSAPQPEMYDISLDKNKEMQAWFKRIEQAVINCPKDSGAAAALRSTVTREPSIGAMDAECTRELALSRQWAGVREKIKILQQSEASLKDYYDSKLHSYKELRDAVERMNLAEHPEECEKLLQLLAQTYRDCTQNAGPEIRLSQWPNLVVLRDVAAYVMSCAESSDSAIGSGCSGPKRSETFHGTSDLTLNVTQVKPKPNIRKHYTVTGASDMHQDAIANATSAILHATSEDSVPTTVSSDVSSSNPALIRPESASQAVAPREVTERLLQRLGNLETLAAKLRTENIALAADLAAARCKPESSPPTAISPNPASSSKDFTHQLEQLRAKEVELSEQRSNFSREKDEWRFRLEHTEHLLEERETALHKIEDSVAHKWIKLREVWDEYRSQGVTLQPLPADPEADGVPYRFARVPISVTTVPEEPQAPSLPLDLASGSSANLSVSQSQSSGSIRKMPSFIANSLARGKLGSHLMHSASSGTIAGATASGEKIPLNNARAREVSPDPRVTTTPTPESSPSSVPSHLAGAAAVNGNASDAASSLGGLPKKLAQNASSTRSKK